MTRLLILSSLLLITACSSPEERTEPIDLPEEAAQLENLTAWSPDNPPEYSFSFENALTFPEIYLVMAPVLGTGLQTAVDEQGNVYLVNLQEKRIDVYQPDGTPGEPIGREGKGPGEFSAPPIIEIQNDRLITYDIGLRRIQIFRLNPAELEHTINPDESKFTELEGIRFGFLTYLRTLSPNRFLIGLPLEERDDRGYLGYYRMDEMGDVDTLKVLETMQQDSHNWTMENGMAAGIPLPYSRRGILAVSDEGSIYSADTENFLIKKIDPEEGYQAAIYYPFENDPLELEEIEELYAEFRVGKMREAGLSETWPALESIMVDDENRIWVSTIVDDKEIYRWWVLNADGSLLGKFDWTRDEEIELVKDGYLYVRVRDSEQGLDHVVRYEIAMQPFQVEETQS